MISVSMEAVMPLTRREFINMAAAGFAAGVLTSSFSLQSATRAKIKVIASMLSRSLIRARSSHLPNNCSPKKVLN